MPHPQAADPVTATIRSLDAIPLSAVSRLRRGVVRGDTSGVPHPHQRPVVLWHKGRLVGPRRPLKPKQVWAIRLHLQRDQRVRDLAMFDLAIDSKLRRCDLVRLKIGQLVVNATVRHRATVIQQKNEQPVQFELTEQTRLLAGLAQPPRQRARRLRLPEPSKGRRAPEHAPVCLSGGRLSRGGRPLPSSLRHPQPAPDQGRAHLQTNRQSAGSADSTGPHKARERGALPGRGCRGRLSTIRGY
jgi:hypothetical protein